MFKGVCTALITPFNKNDEIDYDSFAKLIERQISQGVNALLICGTTGEPPTMTQNEYCSTIKFAIDLINKRVPVYVGCGANSTKIAIERSQYAEFLGADGLLVVTPYYNKCTQDGIFEHYKAISDAVNTPIIAYNVPGRTGVNIKPETIARLATLKNVKAVKEACGNIEQIAKTKSLIRDTDFILYSGDDSLTLPMLSLGCDGMISVASNICVEPFNKMINSFNSGDIKTAQDIHFKYLNLMSDLFCEVNPIPVKYACARLGLCENILRLPLTPLSKDNQNKIDKLLKGLKLI